MIFQGSRNKKTKINSFGGLFLTEGEAHWAEPSDSRPHKTGPTEWVMLRLRRPHTETQSLIGGFTRAAINFSVAWDRLYGLYR